MKKKYICIMLVASLIMSSSTLVFAESSSTSAKTENTTKSAITEEEKVDKTEAKATTEAAINTTDAAVTTTSEAIETTPAAVNGVELPQKTEAKKLSLTEAIKIMKTTGSSAETAKLHKESDVAVGNGYSEKVSKIKKTEDDLDFADQKISAASQQLVSQGVNPILVPSIINASLGATSAVQLAYEAQQAGVTSNNKKIMRLRRDFARENTENNYQAELNKIEADTISIYYKVLLAQDNFKIAKENLATQKKTLKNVETKKEVGVLSKKDVLQAKSSVADAEKEVRSAETQLKFAKMSFNYLLGYNVQQEVIFTDTLESFAEETKITPVDKAVDSAFENRIELKAANLGVEVYDILLKDVSAYPKNSSTYLNAKINLAESQKTLKDAYSKMEIDIRNKYDLVQDKKAAVEAAKELLNYATEGERLMQLTNDEGLSTVEELLSTQVSLYKAKLNLANANSEYALALKSYEFAQGIGTTRVPM